MTPAAWFLAGFALVLLCALLVAVRRLRHAEAALERVVRASAFHHLVMDAMAGKLLRLSAELNEAKASARGHRNGHGVTP